MSDKKRFDVGQRLLLTIGCSPRKSVEEYEVLELSPSEEWVKLKNMDGSQFWEKGINIIIFEKLHTLDKYPEVRNYDGRCAFCASTPGEQHLDDCDYRIRNNIVYTGHDHTETITTIRTHKPSGTAGNDSC